MILIRLISLLPFPVLWLMSDIVCFIIHRLFRYRLSVVRDNLKNCFPEKSEKELRSIEKEFYKHLADYFFETLKCFSISKKQLRERVKFDVRSREILGSPESRIIICSHLFNWEMYGLALDIQTKNNMLYSYQKLSSRFADKLMVKIRGRFGGLGVERHLMANKVRVAREENNSFYILGDHTPVGKAKRYWTYFLNRETGFYYGLGQLGLISRVPVYFLKPVKTGRGRYGIELIELGSEKGAQGILDNYILELENHIKDHCALWLWSHKRWKAGYSNRDIKSSLLLTRV